MILTSIAVFVLQQYEKLSQVPSQTEAIECILKIKNYTEFLLQPLSLGMFVPVDDQGNVLKEPEEYQRWLDAIKINQFNYYADGWEGCKEYHEAKEKVLFKGAVYNDLQPSTQFNYWSINGKKIFIDRNGYPNSPIGLKGEDLTGLDIELTETAIKQLGL